MARAERVAIAWALAFMVLFTAAPGIDLWTTGLFYRPGAGFPMASFPPAEWLRGVLWGASLWLVGIAAAGLMLSRATGSSALWLPGRVWAFVLALYLLGPGLIVNVVLKTHWGRARPAQIVDFGGTATFTPALLPSDQCMGNCSFVSGEGAAAVALAICLWVILRNLRPRPGRREAWLRLAGLVLLACLGAGMRVMAGRHFLSDTVFAGLIVIGLAMLLNRLILARNPPDPLLTTRATPPIAPVTAGMP